MIAVAFRFTAGRFHATPWGHHVNEGVSEWPPSPWRILRALVAVWKRTLGDKIPESRMKHLLEELAAPPEFILPPATVSHTRHFMPWEKKGPQDRTLIFDTFVAMDPDKPVVAVWRETDLDDSLKADLAALLERLPYLGRAESWCKASILTDRFEVTNCKSVGQDGPEGKNWDTVRVLVPEEPLSFRDLCVDTETLRSRALDLSKPPGTRWALYLRQEDCFAVKAESRKLEVSAPNPTVARFAMNSIVPVPLIEAVAVGELARLAAMGQYGRFERALEKSRRSPILSGKDPAGRRLEGHRHAHYLPTDEDKDGRLDHLTIWAPAGLDEMEQETFGRLRALYPRAGRPEIPLVLTGMGQPQDFEVPLFAEGRIWLSATPFVLVRHPKRRGDQVVDGPEDQLRLELSRRGLPAPTSVEPLDRCQLKGRFIRWLEFRRWRSHGGGSGLPMAYGFRVTFPEPIRGPLTLGYGCHFGLGLFIPY